MNPIRRDEILELKCNEGTWHGFHPTHPRRKKTVYGTKERIQFQRNHCRKKRPAEKTLQNPEPWLENVCMHCRSKLADLIKKWDRQQAQQKTEVEA